MSDFVTKDSGKREQFESGMVRDTAEDKPNYALVYDGPMLTRWGGLLTRGAVKYEKRNWMQANGEAELERFKESAARHFAQWMRGETDEDHAAAVYFNINGAEYVKSRLPKPLEEINKPELTATELLARMEQKYPTLTGPADEVDADEEWLIVNGCHCALCTGRRDRLNGTGK